MAPTKRKRVSKKNKQSWRKNVDINDVENFLEDQRLEERLGVKYSDQRNDDLFCIDTKGASKKGANVKPEGKVPLYNQGVNTVGNSLRLVETETPKCFEILEKRTAVPAHLTNKSRIKKENSKSYVAKAIIKRKLEKDLSRAKKWLKQAYTPNEKAPKNSLYDLWSKEKNKRDISRLSEWVSNNTLRHTLYNTGNFKKKIPKSVHSKTSLLPAIETPHPGSSYNPSLKDHKDILEKVVESEVKLIEEEKHLDRVTTKMFKKVPESVQKKEWLKEMSAGLSMTKTESDEEEAGEYKAVNPPVKNKKKTLKKRKKLREALLLKQKLKQQKIEKKKLSDIYKLRKFNEDLNKKEEKILQNMEKRKEYKENKQYATKVLSQTKYNEPEIDFNMADELSGNLRNLRQEGNILYDRFKSLQKRNILEPALKRRVKKREMKKYERSHTKMDWEKDENFSKKQKKMLK